MINPIVSDLVARRRELGLSQRETARRAGLSAGGWNEIENGKHSPTLDNVLAVASALGLVVELTVDE